MTQNTPLFAPGRICTPSEPSLLGSQLDDYVQRHVTGDWGTYGSHTDGEEPESPNSRSIRSGGAVVSFYRTPVCWLFIRTAGLLPGGKADEDTETWCITIFEIPDLLTLREGPADQMPRSAEESGDFAAIEATFG